MNPKIVEDFIELMQDAFERDPRAISSLLSHRVKCNKSLIDHDHITVGTDNTIGVLGIINGLCSKITGKKIAAKFESGILVGFIENEEKLPAEAMASVPFPKCTNRCSAVIILGLSECENICKDKFK